ncbi:hypothetical protein U9M48_044556 [Paspalum notatum var. saurae]|uniref:Uncharacterized protein n=1 Tax=Paspalum notatum var. saurae TaxID=547442 RepID=A0AAQ3UZY2_PASNO
MVSTMARELLCVALLALLTAGVQHAWCSAWSLQQEALVAEESIAGLQLRRLVVVQVDATVTPPLVVGNGGAVAQEGGIANTDAAADGLLYENKRLSPGEPNPIHHKLPPPHRGCGRRR